MARRRKNSEGKLVGAMTLLVACGFGLLVLKTPDVRTAAMALLVPLAFYAANRLIPKLFSADRLLLSVATFLCSIGILVVYRIAPQKGVNQGINFLAGLLAMVLTMQVMRHFSAFRRFLPFVGLVSLGLMAMPVLIGHEQGGAKAWVSLGGLNFQPSEIVKVSLVLVNAYLLSRRKLAFSMAYTGVCLAVLVLQKDMGTALIYYVTALVMMYASTGSMLLLAGGVLGAGGALVAGYDLLKKIGFAHIERRITAWLNPWGRYEQEGFQTVQSLLAIVNGGPFGMGLGAGNASRIPVRDTDSIFPFIVNEFGIIFGVCLVALYMLLLLRAASVATRAGSKANALAALGCASFLVFQTFVIIGGNINLIPITGVTLPFVSYGGTSLLSALSLTGMLLGIDSVNERELKEEASLALGEDGL